MFRHRAVIIAGLVCLVLIAWVYAASNVIERKYNRVRTRPPYPVPAAITELQQTLAVADLHSDSLLWGRNLLKRSTTGHLDIPRLQEAHIALQAFTVAGGPGKKLMVAHSSPILA